ncbi:response regulator transcription factor [Kibdelosporangium philippinense]|uniref:Response regulator transcription factor n=1 Tax=Kibdelosporangium philippinense TaxID=211113 RepID=A0ABS8ZWS6_9PSEU|nr:response regulator transcription factor [Kibdelosporangium philippinense]MCE7011051.1 response regulator transcription factor [Kibdelosporangium philippinense]
MVRVAIADDHPVVRDGLGLLMDMLPDVELVGVAATGLEIVALADAREIDVILMDLRMPKLGGVEAIRKIRARHPDIKVVVLTTYADDVAEIADAYEAGAVDILTKDADRKDIHAAVVAAFKGLVSPRIVRRRENRAPDGLTAREVDVLRLIAAGKSNSEIIAQLGVSEATIKTHINRIFAKTESEHRAQAVRYAYRHGLASSDE